MDTLNPEYLFRQTTAQLRRNGARGGRATARNRNRRAAVVRRSPAVAQSSPKETTARAIALLDAQFPRLRGCEKCGGAAEPADPR